MTALDPHAVRGGEDDGSRSFYFFDIDDNLLFLPTEIRLANVRTGARRGVDTGAFAEIAPRLGRPGDYEEWTMGADAYADFEDHPPAESPFLRDIRKALAAGGEAWRGPSWKFLVYACGKGRDVAFITARGHAPESIAAGFALLAAEGALPCAPNILACYPVGERATQEALGGVGHTTPLLKRAAIRHAVATALERYGDGPPHRFGMSDDDPRNVSALLRAMHGCKRDHPDKRFFVIDTHRAEHMKLEVLSMDRPAPRSG